MFSNSSGITPIGVFTNSKVFLEKLLLNTQISISIYYNHDLPASWSYPEISRIIREFKKNQCEYMLIDCRKIANLQFLAWGMLLAYCQEENIKSIVLFNVSDPIKDMSQMIKGIRKNYAQKLLVIETPSKALKFVADVQRLQA